MSRTIRIANDTYDIVEEHRGSNTFPFALHDLVVQGKRNQELQKIEEKLDAAIEMLNIIERGVVRELLRRGSRGQQ